MSAPLMRRARRYHGPRPPLTLPPHQRAHLALVVANEERDQHHSHPHGGGCSHDGRQLVRSESATAGTRFYLWCPACHSFVSRSFGYSGVWISRATLIAQGIDPDTVPLVGTAPSADPRQGSLFDEGAQ